jgi:hypothetical protein
LTAEKELAAALMLLKATLWLGVAISLLTSLQEQNLYMPNKEGIFVLSHWCAKIMSDKAPLLQHCNTTPMIYSMPNEGVNIDCNQLFANQTTVR